MKKIIATFLSVATLGSTLAFPLIANAGELDFDGFEPKIGFREFSSNSYKVWYRYHGEWELYGKYNSRFQAEKVAFILERQGYRTYVKAR